MKKLYIKIPNNISVFYCDFSNLLIIKKNKNIKLINLDMKIFLFNNTIIIKTLAVKRLQKLSTFLIKQTLLDLITITFSIKLEIKGVGYKFLPVSTDLIELKAGFSHKLFIRPPKRFYLKFLKTTVLYVLNNFYQNVTQFSSFIRSLKIPEPYKNKGIRYEYENLILKPGKKI